ncbi:MAG: family 43 glycosylhydrolase [Paraprevotella sp.]|nr:family 43 glycosylhydrolase [Paraprevotella sp.]
MKTRHILFLFAFTANLTCGAQETASVIANGIPWFDNRRHIVNAHGACLIEDNGKYYLFGEWKSDTTNSFPGFSCYSSTNLADWKFERIVLPRQKSGLMGPNRVGERVKVMKCPKTGEYVMFMHSDDLKYQDPYTVYATCKTINGEYQLQGPVTYQGKAIRKWDIGAFQDDDGKGYLLIHHGPIYRLSDDYHSVDAQVANVPNSGESPAMFKKDGLYYMLYSDLTSWEKNDNFYFTAPKIEGPWTKRGLFCPEGTLTYNSQSTFVLPVKRDNDTLYMYMGDRWSYPHQASAATYVWLPMQVDGEKVSIPEYKQFWDINTSQTVDLLKTCKPLPHTAIKAEAAWGNRTDRMDSSVKGSYIRVSFDDCRMAIKGVSTPHSCYAKVSVTNARKDTVYTSFVDFYSKYDNEAVRLITPKLKRGNYTLIIENTGDRPNWTDKTNRLYGSDGSHVTVTGIYPMN